MVVVFYVFPDMIMIMIVSMSMVVDMSLFMIIGMALKMFMVIRVFMTLKMIMNTLVTCIVVVFVGSALTILLLECFFCDHTYF